MRVASVRTLIGGMMFGLLLATSSASQTMEEVAYFTDSIMEKGDQNFIIRLSGGSSWVLASRTSALINTDVMVVTVTVMVEGKPVPAAWMYIGGEEIPARHLEGVFPTNSAYVTRVVGSEGRGATLRLADGTQVSVPQYDRYYVSRWAPPYKALLSKDRGALYNLKDGGRRISLQPAK
jgi:hypothetical protein